MWKAESKAPHHATELALLATHPGSHVYSQARRANIHVRLQLCLIIYRQNFSLITFTDFTGSFLYFTIISWSSTLLQESCEGLRMKSKQEKYVICHPKASFTEGSQIPTKLSHQMMQVRTENLLQVMEASRSQEGDWPGWEDLPQMLSLSFVTTAPYGNTELVLHIYP